MFWDASALIPLVLPEPRSAFFTDTVAPTDDLRRRAGRLVASHPLRAADALQLAAAQVWCNHRSRGRHFVCWDGSLCDAAQAEGFTVVRLI